MQQPPLIVLARNRGTCNKRPQLGRAGRSQVSRAGPGDVIMNGTNSEVAGGWQDIASRKSLRSYGQIACGTLGGFPGKKKINSDPAFPIDGRALQTRPPRHDPPLFQPLSGHRATAPGGA